MKVNNNNINWEELLMLTDINNEEEKRVVKLL